MTRSRRDLAGMLALAALTLLAYHGIFFNDFVNFDDDRYVTQNPVVQQGLSRSGVIYALTTFDTGNWIPLTWLSLELDATLGGTSPAIFHATNLLLHIANVLLLFQVLRRFHLHRGSSLAVAAIFAVHPLHVESVAWLAERKDVLSTCLMLVTLLCYQSFVSAPARRRYLFVVLTFVLGLMAKPMLVTLPVLLLLLDVWPLRRWNGHLPIDRSPHSDPLPQEERESLKAGDQGKTRKSAGSLIGEKTWLFAIAIFFGVVTVFAQRSEATIVNVQSLPVLFRIANSVHATGWYLAKTVLPRSLCVFYPLSPTSLDWREVLASGVLLVVISFVAGINLRRRPWLLAGWLWFVISLLPVIGLLQVGAQAHADRYSYVPQMGILIILVLSAGELMRWTKLPKVWPMVATGIVLCMLSTLCVRQVDTWRDSETLWNHALAVVPRNWMAHFQLGREDLMRGELTAARNHAELAIEEHPQAPGPYALLGRIEQAQGHWAFAEQEYERALQLDAENRDALLGMAAIHHARGDAGGAIAILQRHIQSHPRDIYARTQLGLLFAEHRQAELALREFDAVLAINPGDANVCRHAGRLLAREGEVERAIPYFEQALRFRPDDEESRTLLERLRGSAQ